jgi:predicted permease
MSLRSSLVRLAGLFHRRELRDREFEAELQSHLQLHIDDYLRSGMSLAEARRQALIKLGGIEQTREAWRQQRGLPAIESLGQDLRYALRAMRKNPGFTSIALLTLTLGIGANTALFSVVNGVLLNPLPYPHSEQLAILYHKSGITDQGSVSYPNFLDWQRENQTFSSMAAFREQSFNLTGEGEPTRLSGHEVSADFFPTLEVNPVLGRLFTPDEDRVGGAPVALIGGGLWKTRYGSSSSVLGRGITLNGVRYTIIGVIPESFLFYNGFGTQVWTPIGQWNDPTFRNRRVSMGMNVIGRMKMGVTLDRARQDMERVAHNLAEAYPDADKGTSVTLVSFKQDMIGDIAPFLFVLLGAVGFVLLIACANVANLMLARATGRTREFALRSALGATQARLVRQLLSESVLLSVIGGALGLALAANGTKSILALLPDAVPRSHEISMDLRVLIFTLAVSLLAGIAFGLAPALRIWRTNLTDALKESGRGLAGSRGRAQNAFVVIEMATALVLLVGAGLMIRSLAALWSVNPGFDPHNALSFEVAMQPDLGSDAAHIRAELRKLHQAVRNQPGVLAASVLAGAVPMHGDSEVPFWKIDEPKPATDAETKWTLFYGVEPDYLTAMGLHLLSGRFVTESDSEHTSPVVVVDDYFVERYFAGENPIGKRINVGLLDLQPEIVGVVGHVKQWGLEADATAKVQAQIYIPCMQIPDRFMPLVGNGISMVVRTANDPGAQIPALRKAIANSNAQQVVYGAETLEDIIAGSLAARRFSMVLLGIFAALAVLLSSVGIYGVISYLVGQRIQEIGTRIALGAQRGDVMRLILGRGFALTLSGVGAGSVLALILSRQMKKVIYGVSASDPATFAAVAVLLMVIALLACYVPARRAMRVDPIIALRYE